MQTIDMHCWLILTASLLTSCAAIIGLIVDSYNETLPENIGLAMVALSGLIVAGQIGVHGFTHISGVSMQAVSVAFYSIAIVMKHRKGLR